MNKKLNRRRVALLAGAVLALIVFSTTNLSSARTAPRTMATFRDLIYLNADGTVASGSDRTRSDGKGPYIDLTDCVYANVFTVKQGGSFFMRTVSRGCTTPNPRTVVLDFSDFAPTGASECADSPRAMGVCTDQDGNGNELNLCGANAIVDASFNVPSLFRTPQLSPLAVDVEFNLRSDFSKTRAYLLRYQDAVVWDATAPNERVMQGVRAVLLKSVPKSTQYPHGLKCLGEYSMPFEQTVSK
jgi:hypothetical protein